MTNPPIYPLLFDPIYQYRLWGGRKLAKLLAKPLPKGDPIGEAWLLSDRADHASQVLNGSLKGMTITDLMKHYQAVLMGKFADHYERFPLLLKFLDCKEVLSVQVHPADDQLQYIPKGDSGKTEAWVVLETGKKARIYAGLTPGTTAENLKRSITDKHVADHLHSFTPKVGDGIFIKSGTVHTLGGAVVFEVQENSDTTFRLYDWDRTDAKTGKPRELQVKEALACIDFKQVNIGPVKRVVAEQPGLNKEKLFDNDHFTLWRVKSGDVFMVGAKNEPRILIGIEGYGSVEFEGVNYPLRKGSVMLLPAILGECSCLPRGAVTLLEIGIPSEKHTK
ncbi:type I phosphomannose isomerase catalytic subunit [Mucilaginibacter sp. SP1R1]|uniref:type I phosphomannose isomerase catalytic subunit n=1 Tax=Mucilaginibacter sp. SP1R1 TaxID=2723091 RepID=UPI001621412C|nr:type I phosphomannose isomerase catalytic subunit [Mucilaginibacter sp. SP1R1]MBB6152678.1 mannose-6-phosphate isomerase [Mucilaginibacter sp. SP1R1]